MRSQTVILLILSVLFAADSAFGQKKTVRKRLAKKAAVKSPPASEPTKTRSGEVKILATEAQSDIEEPFVFVARDSETYERLRKLNPKLPTADSIDFQTTAIVAAFAGTRPTPGYDVVFSGSANNLKISLTEPPKDQMLAQVLTAPSRVVAVAVAEEQSLTLDLAANWLTKASVYQISNGKFEASGGFVGKSEKFDLNGTIKIWRAHNLATALFAVGDAANSKRKLSDAASGAIENGKITLARVDAGTLIESPRSPLLARGEIADKKLSLTFEPLPSNVADGFEGRGTLEAKR